MGRALSVNNFYNAKFKTFDFDDVWLDFVGRPEIKGSWFIWGNSGNGKTVFAAKLAKYLSSFKKVAYNSLEEGKSESLRRAFEIAGIENGDRIIILDKEPISELITRIEKPNSPDIYINDSFQYTGLSRDKYKTLLSNYPNKLFIFTSHADGRQPSGRTAKAVRFDADIKIWVEGFKATAQSRFGGGKPYVIWDKGAEIYWNK